VRPGDQGATLPSVFPALLKPNHGDSSQGITKDSVVYNEKALLDSLDRLRQDFPRRGVLVQEFLTGAEYSVQLIANPDQGLRALAILEVDYSKLDENLPTWATSPSGSQTAPTGRRSGIARRRWPIRCNSS
jgi:D-alanine-D-alanine ligase